jgi:hypothetical protein
MVFSIKINFAVNIKVVHTITGNIFEHDGASALLVLSHFKFDFVKCVMTAGCYMGNDFIAVAKNTIGVAVIITKHSDLIHDQITHNDLAWNEVFLC